MVQFKTSKKVGWKWFFNAICAQNGNPFFIYFEIETRFDINWLIPVREVTEEHILKKKKLFHFPKRKISLQASTG